MPQADIGHDMARKRKSYHAALPRGFTAGAPVEAIKAEFGRVLQKRMVDKNWNQSDMAREAARFMPDKTFQRDNISQYVRGLSLPGPVRLNALARALGCKPTDLLPVRSSETIDAVAPPLDARDLGDGTVWLRVNQAVPQSIALQIMQLLMQGSSR
jgi:transcriptional regulator with XRE-family HTH domain